MEASEARRLRELEDENRRLKQMVADFSLDIHALKEVLKKSGELPRAPSRDALSAGDVCDEPAPSCRLAEQPRATQRYESRRAQVPELRERLVELAHQRPRFGYPRLYVLLRRDGFAVNKKRVYRLYREAGLKLRAKRRRRGAPRERFPMTPARGANQSWSIDFVADRLGDG